MDPNQKKLPKSMDPSKLKGWDKQMNNKSSHFLITPTFWCALNILSLFFMALIALSFFFYHETDKLREKIIQYDEVCKEFRQTGEPCIIEFTLDEDLMNPSVYYRLDNFYSNSRSFQLYSFAQLRGDDYDDRCLQYETNSELQEGNWTDTNSFDASLKSDAMLSQVAYPCGPIARYYFQDIFEWVGSTDGSFNVTINDTDIAHDIDRDAKFITNEEKQNESAYWTDVENEHLMVWYQMETLTDFQKLYGRVNGIMRGGLTYQMQIIDSFDSEAIGNKKYVKFTELSSFGGKNYFLAAFFFGAACIIFGVIIMFFVCHFTKQNKNKNIDSDAYINSLSY